jgi:hypothetical protein
MFTGASTSTWRDKRIAPEDYEDVARQVAVARKARGRMVDFDWLFTRDDLLRLRHAVYEWGSGVNPDLVVVTRDDTRSAMRLPGGQGGPVSHEHDAQRQKERKSHHRGELYGDDKCC